MIQRKENKRTKLFRKIIPPPNKQKIKSKHNLKHYYSDHINIKLVMVKIHGSVGTKLMVCYGQKHGQFH